MDKPRWKSKTFWTGVAAVVGALGGYLTGELALSPALQVVVTGLTAIFLRDAIRTNAG